MHKTLGEIAEIVRGELLGDADFLITGLNGIQDAREGDLTFIANPKYLPFLKTTKASAVLTSREIKPLQGKSMIRTDNPSLAFAQVIASVSKEDALYVKGIHPSAVIAPDALLGRDVAVGPHAVIENGASIGDGTVIHAGVYIGPRTRVGSECLIYPQVAVRERVEIGSRVVIHCGAVIGADGFGFEQIDGRHHKIPQVGTVVIEDDVEIGANVTIDRARFDKTRIGRGTKIDNLVQIAHNVQIGEDSIIVAQAGISGSTTVGKGSILAGQAGVAGHLTIGEGSVIASQAGVTKSLPPFSKVSGYPAKPHDQAKRVNAALQRLPRYVKTILTLEKKVKELETKIKGLEKAKVRKDCSPSSRSKKGDRKIPAANRRQR